MRYNSTLSFVVRKKVYDDLGGFDYVDTNGQTFKAYMQPVKAENILKEYGIVTNKPYRVVTKEKLNQPLESTTLTDGTQKYKILEYLDLKYGILLVEVI
ncbi:hypothetical protein QT711_03110 [Sporosarcina saromensis]|uniref:Uncharacterized protein n=1 Tax=Sporosarcina saromensis TaxID=359365 RepID=A0ABU4G5A9_9BACL|nr:hypothetical protein [Sporosarcina saromensis]MDW0112159.1 hypothetical protein [Sporosarcina saromensis]